MVKNKKSQEVNLYNFNAHDEEENSKKKKQRKVKKKANSKNKNINSKEENNKFDLDNEIVIGLAKKQQIVDNKAKNKKTNTKKKKIKKAKNNKKNKQRSPISKKTQEIKNKKRKRKLKILKYTLLSFCIIGVIIIAMLSPLFNIKQIEVQGNEKITTEQIISLAQVSIEENIFKISKRKSTRKNIRKSIYKKCSNKKRTSFKISNNGRRKRSNLYDRIWKWIYIYK